MASSTRKNVQPLNEQSGQPQGEQDINWLYLQQTSSKRISNEQVTVGTLAASAGHHRNGPITSSGEARDGKSKFKSLSQKRVLGVANQFKQATAQSTEREVAQVYQNNGFSAQARHLENQATAARRRSRGNGADASRSGSRANANLNQESSQTRHTRNPRHSKPITGFNIEAAQGNNKTERVDPMRIEHSIDLDQAHDVKFEQTAPVSFAHKHKKGERNNNECNDLAGSSDLQTAMVDRQTSDGRNGQFHQRHYTIMTPYHQKNLELDRNPKRDSIQSNNPAKKRAQNGQRQFDVIAPPRASLVANIAKESLKVTASELQHKKPVTRRHEIKRSTGNSSRNDNLEISGKQPATDDPGVKQVVLHYLQNPEGQALAKKDKEMLDKIDTKVKLHPNSSQDAILSRSQFTHIDNSLPCREFEDSAQNYQSISQPSVINFSKTQETKQARPEPTVVASNIAGKRAIQMQEVASSQRREKTKSRFFETESVQNRVNLAKTNERDTVVVHEQQLFENKQINANMRIKARNLNNMREEIHMNRSTEPHQRNSQIESAQPDKSKTVHAPITEPQSANFTPCSRQSTGMQYEAARRQNTEQGTNNQIQNAMNIVDNPNRSDFASSGLQVMTNTPNAQSRRREKTGKVQNFQIIEASASSESPLQNKEIDYDSFQKYTPKRRARRQENDKKVVQSQNLNGEQEKINDIAVQNQLALQGLIISKNVSSSLYPPTFAASQNLERARQNSKQNAVKNLEVAAVQAESKTGSHVTSQNRAQHVRKVEKLQKSRFGELAPHFGINPNPSTAQTKSKSQKAPAQERQSTNMYHFNSVVLPGEYQTVNTNSQTYQHAVSPAQRAAPQRSPAAGKGDGKFQNAMNQLISKHASIDSQGSAPNHLRHLPGSAQAGQELDYFNKEVLFSELTQERDKSDKNNKINVVIHSSQLANITGLSQNPGSTAKNTATTKEKPNTGLVPDIQKSKELSSFLGVSQAQIFQKQQHAKEENQQLQARRKVSIDNNARSSPFQQQTKRGERLQNQQHEVLTNQKTTLRLEDRSYSKDDGAPVKITSSNSLHGLMNQQYQNEPKNGNLIHVAQIGQNSQQAQHEQNCRRNHLNQSRKNFYKTTYIGQKVQASTESSQTREEVPPQASNNFNIAAVQDPRTQVGAHLKNYQYAHVVQAPGQVQMLFQMNPRFPDFRQPQELSAYAQMQHMSKLNPNVSVEIVTSQHSPQSVLQQEVVQIKEEPPRPQMLNISPYKLVFCVSSGNNSELIRRAMRSSPKRKDNWQELSNDAINTYGAPCHFKWQPVSTGFKFSQMSAYNQGTGHTETKQIFNHWDQHSWLSEKSRLFEILTQYSTNKLKENVFDYLPVTFFVEGYSLNAAPHANKAMTQFINSFYALEDIKKRTARFFEQKDKKPSSTEVNNIQATDDDNQERGESVQPAELYSQLADSFIFKYFYSNKRSLIIQHKKEAREEQQAHQHLLSINEEVGSGPKMLKKHIFKLTMPLCHFTGYNLWLLKPTRLNRGRGIHVVNNLSYLRQLIAQYCEGFHHKGQSSQKSQLELQKQDPMPYKDKPQDGSHVYRGDSVQRLDVTKTPNKRASKLNHLKSSERASINEESASPDRREQQSQPEHNTPSISGTFGFAGTGGGGASTGTMKHNSFIFQKYIERPLLIHGRKFDIRCWVLWNYDGKVYLFKEGYLRTSSKPYSINPDNPDDMFTHLTNNAVQKTSKDYGAFEDGNQISYQAFQEYCESQTENKRLSNYSVKDHFIPTIKKQIARTIFATKDLIDPMKRKHCFELFGYDFIIDEDLNTWMIEVNTNPCLEESSSILKMLLPRMVEDMLCLSVDALFNNYKGMINDNIQPEFTTGGSPRVSKTQNLKQKPYTYPSVDGYPDEENLWELVVDIRDKKRRKEAKAKYLTPIQLNSSHAFQLKDRGFKIKKYAQPQNWMTFKEQLAAREERGAKYQSSDNAVDKERKINSTDELSNVSEKEEYKNESAQAEM